MINVAICDDDPAILEELSGYARAYFLEYGREADIALFSDPRAFAETFAADMFHIALLDIMMPGRSGIELARNIYEMDRNCAIAFVTSSPDFAIQGYGVNAVSYLLKPVSREMIAEVLDKCMERIEKGQARHRSISVKEGSHRKKIDLARTVFLESRNKQVLIHCDDGTVICSGKLSDLLVQLPGHFIQIHKSYVVNLTRMKAMSRTEMVSDADQRVPISRHFQKDAVKRYLAYIASEA